MYRIRLNSIINKVKGITPIKIVVLSFLITIIIGTFLLSLPISHKGYENISLVDTAFIATSSTCVTGLSLFDTWSKWTMFGQFIIMMLIEIGGLGLISFAVGTTLFLRKKLGIRKLRIVKEYTSSNAEDIPHVINMILVASFIFEALGTIILSLRFVPKYGIYGIWVALFTSISAYCNAGFDIMGFISPNISFTMYASDPLVCTVIESLVFTGGLGFLVLLDIYMYIKNKIKFKKSSVKISLHSKIVLITSIFLVLFGAVMFFAFENSNTLNNADVSKKINASLFQSVISRTAGFYTVDIGAERGITKLLTTILMFIGASPGSTGGGIKTTSFVILVMLVISVLKGEQDVSIGHHKIDKNVVYKSLALVILSACIVLVGTGIIQVVELYKNFKMIDILFEVTSALATVGLSAGITPYLSTISKITLMIIMFIGRVGPVSLICAVTIRKSKRVEHVLPEGKVIIG